MSDKRRAMIGSSALRYVAVAVLLLLGLVFSAVADVRIEFESLEGWEPVSFIGNFDDSEYRVVAEGGMSYLEAVSEDTISGIVFTEEVATAAFPLLHIRWRVGEFPSGATPTVEELDDFALRVYLLFFTPVEELSRIDRIRFRFVRSLYGSYPPERILGYVWPAEPMPSPYPSKVNSQAVYIELDSGHPEEGEWREHVVDIESDYRSVYGADPPETVRVAVISDTDSTGGSAKGLIDHIRFTRR